MENQDPTNMNGVSGRPGCLKENNYSSKRSPGKPSDDITNVLKKELRKKEVVVANLRTMLDFEQDRVLNLSQEKTEHKEQIKKLERLVKEQRTKLTGLDEARKWLDDAELSQHTIKTLTEEKEKFLNKIQQLKEATKDLPFVEAARNELQTEKEKLLSKASCLERQNEQLQQRLKNWEESDYAASVLQQHLSILKEELEAKERTILDLNSIVEVYQDKLETHKEQSNHDHLDSSDVGEVIADVCSPFKNTGNELTSLQNEVDTLHDEKNELKKCLDTFEADLRKSKESNIKLENELGSLQRLNDLLILQVHENQSQLTKMDERIQMKDLSITELTTEKNDLKDNVAKLNAEILEGKVHSQELQENNRSALQAIEQLKGEIKNHQKDISSLCGNVSALHEEKSVLLNEFSKLDEMGKALCTEVSAKRRTVEELSLRLDNLETDLKELRNENEEQEDKLKCIKEEKEALECSLSVLQKNHELLLSSHNESISEKEKLSLQLQKLHVHFQATEAAKSQLLHKLNDFQMENHSLVNRISDLGQENSRILKQTEELETENGVLLKKMESLELDIAARKNENSHLQEKVVDLLSQKSALEDDVSGLKSLNQEMSENYQMALNEISTISDCLSSSRNDVLSLEASHSQLQSDMLETKNENEVLLGKYSASQNINENCLREIQDLTSMCNNSDETISSLNHKLQESLNSVSELSENIRVVNHKNDELGLQNESLLKQKTYFMETLSQLELEVNSLRQTVETLYDKTAKLESDKLALECQLQDAKENVSASSTKATMTSPKMKVEDVVYEKDATIKYLEAQLKTLEDRNTEMLFDKTDRINALVNENASIFDKVQGLSLEIKLKDKQIASLESENRGAHQQLIESETTWNREKSELIENNRNHVHMLNGEVESLKKEIVDVLLQQESTTSEMLSFRKQIDNLESDLNLTLREKSDVISALCEKEENIRLLRESLEELKLASDEVSKLSESRGGKIEALESDLKTMAQELANKNEIVQNVTILQEELHKLKNEISVLENNADTLDLLQKEVIAISEEKTLLGNTVSSQINYINELTDRLVKSSQANDLLVAETIKSAKDKVDLQENLNSLLTSKEQVEERLSILSTRADSLFKETTEKEDQINDLKLCLTNIKEEKEQVLNELKEKSKALEDCIQDSSRLDHKNTSLMSELKEKTEQIESLNTCICSLSEELESATCRLAGASDRISASTLRSINNPALKHWMDQFNSLSKKISDMQRKYVEQSEHSLNKTFSVREECQFENDFLSMIRVQINSWFTSSASLFEGFETEKERSQTKELQSKTSDLTMLREKVEGLQKRLESKEREAAIFKEAQVICKQKMKDEKEWHETQESSWRQELTSSKEQVTSLQAALEDEKLKCQETGKYYLREMKVVHKKYQEIINQHNNTNKELSQGKMQLASLNKRYSDLKEMYKLSEEKLKNASASLKKQRFENERLKNELRCSQMKLEEPHRRTSMLPTSSFMLDSFCSSNDFSFDSGRFAKPVVPSNRFACDEEEGQFLDQSRNISDLQEGRVDMGRDCSTRENSRLQELQRRNTLCRPHLRSQYPVETQSVADTSDIHVDEITQTPANAKKAALAVAAASSLSRTSTPPMDKLGQRKRKEFWQVPLEVLTPAKKASQIPKPTSSIKKNKRKPFFQAFSPFRKDKQKGFRP